jgi:NAD(P)-dependent dehydrogenase (short-subunit alcohol dehydrogenase family)
MDVDAKGVFLCSRAAIRRMIPRGEHAVVVPAIARCGGDAPATWDSLVPLEAALAGGIPG